MKTIRPAWAKWPLITIALLGGVFLLLTLTLTFWMEPIVDRVVRRGLEQLDDSGYRVDYQELDLKPLRRKIALHQVTLSVDSSQQARLLAQGSYITGQLDKLEIQLDRYPYWESERFLSIAKVILQRPYIQVHQASAGSERDSLSLPTNTFQWIQPYLDSVWVKAVQVHDGQVLRMLYDSSSVDTLTLPPVYVSIRDVRLDSLRALAHDGLPTVSSWVADADTFRTVSADSLYTFSVGHTHADLVGGSLAFSDVRLQPNFQKGEFAARIGEQKDRMEAYVHAVGLEGLQMSRFLRDRTVLARRMALDSATLSIFKDKRLRRNTDEKPLIQAMLQSVPLVFRIDTITLTSGQIVYEEQNSLSKKAGRVAFDDLYATLYGVTNNQEANLPLWVDARANLMGEGRLEVSFQVPVGRSDGTHYLKGRLDRIPLARMNEFLEPVAFASVRDGVANLLDFEMAVNEQVAKGEVRFIYQDLKVDLLNQENPDSPALKELLGTWLANWFVVKTDNPTRSQPLRIGTVHFERDPSRSVFSYWCHALLSGVKESIGMPESVEPTVSIETSSEEEQDNPGLFKKIFGQKEE